MIRESAMQITQRGDRYFRWRGAEVSRVETLFDAVIALAMTLVIVSLDVPESFEDLLQSFRRLPAFAASFFVLVMLWYYHFIFHRRYGLEDLPTIMLNSVSVFLVLLYVYPMKFLYTGLFDRGQIVMADEDYPTLMRMFSCGWIGIFTVFVLMYGYAYLKRASLRLNRSEQLMTLHGMSSHGLHVFVGVLSLSLTLFDRKLLPFAGLVYFLIGPLQGINGWLFGRQIECSREEGELLEEEPGE